jgi:capsular polysaccharide biosynthesis protein
MGATSRTASVPGWAQVPDPDPEDWGRLVHPYGATMELRVLELGAVSVVVDEGVVYDQDGRVVDESVKAEWALDRPGVLPLLRPRSPSEIGDGAIALITNPAQRRSYGHWLIDALPRLFVLEQVAPDTSFTLLVSEKVSGAARRSLELYARGRHELRFLPARTVASVDSLRLPCFVPYPHTGAMPAVVVDWLRQVVAGSTGSAPSPSARRLYVTRSPELDRKLLDEGEVIEALEARSFEVVRPERMTFDEQVALFAGASVVVGVHGSGLTNMLFAPVPTRIVEIMPESRDAAPTVAPYNRLLAESVGHDYRRVRGDGMSPLGAFRVDPAAVVAAVESP